MFLSFRQDAKGLDTFLEKLSSIIKSLSWSWMKSTSCNNWYYIILITIITIISNVISIHIMVLWFWMFNREIRQFFENRQCHHYEEKVELLIEDLGNSKHFVSSRSLQPYSLNKVTIVNMIFRLPLNHWYFEFHWFSGTICPLS